jgi:hypothetical protein
MTTPIVLSVTDELIAELEQECRLGADQHAGMGHDYDSRLFDRIGDTLAAILSERSELKRDAERLDWMISEQCIMRVQNGTRSPMVYSLWWSTLGEGQREWYVSPRAAIDAAMQP